MFADGSYCRAIFELMVNYDNLTAKRSKGGTQWVSKPEGVSVTGVWIVVNAPPDKGEEFMEAWDPFLEVRPDDKPAVDGVVNDQNLDWRGGQAPRVWSMCDGAHIAVLGDDFQLAGGIDPASPEEEWRWGEHEAAEEEAGFKSVDCAFFFVHLLVRVALPTKYVNFICDQSAQWEQVESSDAEDAACSVICYLFLCRTYSSE